MNDTRTAALAAAVGIDMKVNREKAVEADEKASDARAAAVPLPNFAAALTAPKPIPQTRISAISGGRLVEWVRRPGASCLGGDWAPAGDDTPEHHGAVGDGVADDTVALRAWAAAIPEGGRGVLVGPYKITGPITFDKDDIEVFGQNAVIDMSSAPPNSIAFIFTKGAETNYPLTSDGTGRFTSMSPANLVASGIVPGSYVRLFSNAVLDPGRTNSRIGEIARVHATNPATGQITLGYADYGQPITPNPLTFHHRVSDGAQIARVRELRGVELTGNCLIIGGTSFTTRHIGIELRSCIDPHIGNGWRGQYLGNRWLHLRSCQSGVLRIGGVFDSPADTSGYGISLSDGTADIIIHGIAGESVRHLISTNNSSTDMIGIPQRITIDGFHAGNSSGSNGGSMSGGDALDTHAASVFITFRNGVIYAPSGQAINIEGAHVTVENVEIFGPVGANQAIHFYNWTNLAADYTARNIRYRGPAPASGIIRMRNLGAGSLRRAVVDGLEFDSDVGLAVYITGAKIAEISNVRGNRLGAPNLGVVTTEDCDVVRINGLSGEMMNDIPAAKIRRCKRIFVNGVQVGVMPGATQSPIDLDDGSTGNLVSALVTGCAGWAKSGSASPALVRRRSITGTPTVLVGAESNLPVGSGPLLL